MEPLREPWVLRPDITFLNHGSFGACPRAVLDVQSALRLELEREPVQFLWRRLQGMLEGARAEVAAFVGADPNDVVFVRNATSGVNAVLRSLDFRPGDELLITDQAYPACRATLDFVAARSGARVVVAKLPFPLRSEDELIAPILEAVTPRTRLALIDHVTSPTGLVLPLARIVRELAARGVDTLVDGAHAPGMVELDLRTLGAAYYAANFHKHTCAPKGAAMLWVREDKQHELHPTTISHGYASTRARPKFLEEFDWTGTDDVTSWLCIPEALRYVGSLLDGGWPAIRARNRALVLEARGLLCEALGIAPPSPPSTIGTLATVPLPDDGAIVDAAFFAHPLQVALYERHRIEVPVVVWPAPPAKHVRITAHLHNGSGDYLRLVEALKAESQVR